MSDWPASWRGRWEARDGKTIRIAVSGSELSVSAAPTADADPYRSAELLGGGTKLIERLPATCFVDEGGRRYLEIEAGTPGLGPTYRLSAFVEAADGDLCGAEDSARVEDVILVPNTSIGLYDDFEDDLGVPWALPLEPMRWQAGPE